MAKNLRILVVDDDEDNANSLGELFEMEALQNGAMGVLSKPIDVAKLLKTVDEVMPSGIVLISEDDTSFGDRLKRLIDGAGLRCNLLKREFDVLLDGGSLAIIVTRSGQHGDDSHEALRDVAVTGVLNKPFDPLRLLQRLDSLAA